MGILLSASLGWRISEENFWKNTRAGEVVNNLKLRASYGVLGNQNIGVYPYQQTYDLDHNYPLGNPATLVPGTYVSTYRNQGSYLGKDSYHQLWVWTSGCSIIR